MQKVEVSQGDIILIDFNPSRGHEQKGYRPALVVSNRDFTQLTESLAIVLPISTTKNRFPLHIPLPKGLRTKGVVEVQQVTTFDLAARGFKVVENVSKTDSKYIDEILSVLSELTEKEL